MKTRDIHISLTTNPVTQIEKTHYSLSHMGEKGHRVKDVSV